MINGHMDLLKRGGLILSGRRNFCDDRRDIADVLDDAGEREARLPDEIDT
jgi:hypothetical protein